MLQIVIIQLVDFMELFIDHPVLSLNLAATLVIIEGLYHLTPTHFIV